MQDNGKLPFEWVVPSSASPVTRGELEAAGAELEGDDRPFTPPKGQEVDYAEAAFEPMTVIFGSIGLVYLARQVLSFVKDLHHDGLIVDTRTKSITIRPHPSLDRGELLVVSQAGNQFFKRENTPDLEPLIAAIKAG